MTSVKPELNSCAIPHKTCRALRRESRNPQPINQTQRACNEAQAATETILDHISHPLAAPKRLCCELRPAAQAFSSSFSVHPLASLSSHEHWSNGTSTRRLLPRRVRKYNIYTPYTQPRNGNTRQVALPRARQADDQEETRGHTIPMSTSAMAVETPRAFSRAGHT
jgi:hypothetical protein